eukprot:m.134245 g.134245  ORF g.134245 m.134245 type:complete len:664 (+) comp29727_c0_seq1:280-2271(+)
MEGNSPNHETVTMPPKPAPLRKPTMLRSNRPSFNATAKQTPTPPPTIAMPPPPTTPPPPQTPPTPPPTTVSGVTPIVTSNKPAITRNKPKIPFVHKSPPTKTQIIDNEHTKNSSNSADPTTTMARKHTTAQTQDSGYEKPVTFPADLDTDELHTPAPPPRLHRTNKPSAADSPPIAIEPPTYEYQPFNDVNFQSPSKRPLAGENFRRLPSERSAYSSAGYEADSDSTDIYYAEPVVGRSGSRRRSTAPTLSTQPRYDKPYEPSERDRDPVYAVADHIDEGSDAYAYHYAANETPRYATVSDSPLHRRVYSKISDVSDTVSFMGDSVDNNDDDDVVDSISYPFTLIQRGRLSSLSTLLIDDTALELLISYCMETFCVGDVLLWLDAEQFRLLGSASENDLKRYSEMIARKFIINDAELTATLPEIMRESTLDKVKNGPWTPELYQQAQAHVFTNLQRTALPGFFKSAAGLAYTKSILEREMSKQKNLELETMVPLSAVVEEAEKVSEDKETYHVYKINVKTEKAAFSIWRRFSELHRYHTMLKLDFASKILHNFPRKQIFRSQTSSIVSRRCHDIGTYLDVALENESVRQCNHTRRLFRQTIADIEKERLLNASLPPPLPPPKGAMHKHLSSQSDDYDNMLDTKTTPPPSASQAVVERLKSTAE